MSPESNLDDLAKKLQKQKADADYRRRREIQQFSHRFRFAAITMLTLLMLLGFIFYVLALRNPHPLLTYLVVFSFLAGWLYLLILPVSFLIRTTLVAYVLEKHWVWLSLAIGLPIDLYFLPKPAATSVFSWIGRIPIIFFAFLLWGFIRRKQRKTVFLQEVRLKEALWTRLLPLGVLDIALFGFWNIRPVPSASQNTPSPDGS
ncbi:MAG: hypothetical protein DSY55_06250 [Clostridia bacterium]|nr:MAG: hypothetical protein DSY55_06250 [Clostridia bacterium]